MLWRTCWSECHRFPCLIFKLFYLLLKYLLSFMLYLNCMNTSRDQLPIIPIEDFVQWKQMRNNAILAWLWINNESNREKLIVGDIFGLSDRELIQINTRTTKNKPVSQILISKEQNLIKWRKPHYVISLRGWWTQPGRSFGNSLR